MGAEEGGKELETHQGSVETLIRLLSGLGRGGIRGRDVSPSDLLSNVTPSPQPPTMPQMGIKSKMVTGIM